MTPTTAYFLRHFGEHGPRAAAVVARHRLAEKEASAMTSHEDLRALRVAIRELEEMKPFDPVYAPATRPRLRAGVGLVTMMDLAQEVKREWGME